MTKKSAPKGGTKQDQQKAENDKLDEVRKQAGYKWLAERGKRQEAVELTTIETKLKAAIEAVLGRGKATPALIERLSLEAGTPWGKPYEKPNIVSGKISILAKSEVTEGTDANMAQALRSIFKATASGRSGPKTGAIRHIHVGGYANQNIIFNEDTSVVLGIVDFHIDKKSMKGGNANKVMKVEDRNGGTTQDLFVEGDRIYY